MFRRIMFLIVVASMCVPPALASEHVAISLGRAGEVAKAGNAKEKQLAMTLAGITRPRALIHDMKRNDLILVGERDSKLPSLTLDEWSVAMRSEFVVNRDPVVSIDQTPETEKTGKQAVRFEGALKDTQFGADMLAADIVLKQLGLGKTSAKVFGVPSFLDLSAASYKEKPTEQSDFTRFWFLPMRSESYVFARNSIVIVEEYKIDVQNQRYIDGKGAKNSDPAVSGFAQGVRSSFGDLKTRFPSLARMEQLYYVTALVQGLSVLGVEKSDPNIAYWLDVHKVRHVETRSTYPLEENSTNVTLDGGKVAKISLSGGIDLDAMIVNLQDGMPDALKEYVMVSRPAQASLSWEVPLVSLSWSFDIDRAAVEAAKKKLQSKHDAGMSIQRQVTQFQQGRPGGIQPTPVHIPSADFRYSTSRDISTHMLANRLTQVSPDIGGVMLSGVASLAGGGPANVDLSGGNFSFIVDGKNARLAPEAFRKFITALWTVYYSNQDPGISIDPIAPGVDKHLVRYIGKVVNTDLGRVMRDADYLMKKWSVGTERPDIQGFKNPDEYAARARVLYLAASRFWFIPEDMKFKRSDEMLLFDDGRMTIQTEYLTNSAKKHADPANEKFADFFTEHYPEISEKYPVYKALFEYAKMVSLAKYLKEQGIPLFWFLMANKDLVLTEDSPGTVDELVKGSDYFRDITISGGVNLDFDAEDQDHYVYDEAAVDAINEARLKYASSTQSTTSISPDRKPIKTGPDPFSFDLGKESYTVVPQHSLTSGKDRRGIRYQTDMALRGRGLQLTQQSLDILKAELVYRETMEEMEPVLKTMKKHNLDQEEIYALYQVKKKKAEKRVEGILGRLDKIKNKKYSDRNEFITALELSIGAEQTERLKHQISKVSYYSTNLELVRYFNSKKRSSGEFGNGWRLLVPYSIKSYGKTKTEFSNLIIPEKMALVNLLTGEEEILTFSTERYSNAGYVPEKLENSQVVGLFMMTDASYRLADKLGNEFWFNPRGCLTDMVFSKDHHIRYEYLDGFTDAFEHTPYSIEPHGEERIPFLNVIIPKRMRLKDHVHGVTEILTFSDKGDFAGYVPVKGQKSRFKIMAMMSDASFRLIDINGNETALTSSGRFEKMAVSDERPMVSAVSQGNHRIAFKYTIDNSGNVVIASASLSEDGNGAAPTFVVQYEYDREGRLADIKKINNRKARNCDIQRTPEFASNW